MRRPRNALERPAHVLDLLAALAFLSILAAAAAAIYLLMPRLALLTVLAIILVWIIGGAENYAAAMRLLDVMGAGRLGRFRHPHDLTYKETMRRRAMQERPPDHERTA